MSRDGKILHNLALDGACATRVAVDDAGNKMILDLVLQQLLIYPQGKYDSPIVKKMPSKLDVNFNAYNQFCLGRDGIFAMVSSSYPPAVHFLELS